MRGSVPLPDVSALPNIDAGRADPRIRGGITLEIMNVKVDKEADALHLTLSDAEVVESAEVAPGVIIDYDASEQVAGIEILYLSRRAPQTERPPMDVVPR